MSEYTEGILTDGAAILKDGVQITITEILATLNRIETIERETAEKCASLSRLYIKGIRKFDKGFNESSNQTYKEIRDHFNLGETL